MASAAVPSYPLCQGKGGIVKLYVHVCAGLMLAAVPALAGDDEQRERLSGSWQESAAGDASSLWTIENNNGKLRITETVKGEKQVEFECSPTGKECEGSDHGRRAKVSLWFNGSKLVAMVTRGNDVLKRGFQVSADGTELQMEVISITPPAEPLLIRLRRTETSTNPQ
jgi:hypothetical protein